MPVGRGGSPGRRTSGSISEDRLGKIHSDNSRGSGSRREDRLGRIHSDWMLPEAAAANNSNNNSRDNASSSSASVASVSSSSLFTSSSLGTQQQPRAAQPPVTSQTNQEITAPEELFKGGGGDTETVSTASLSTLFSSVAATTEENKSYATEEKSYDLFSSVVGATEENKVDKLAMLTVSTETTSNNALMGSPLPGFSSSASAASAPAHQQPPIHRPNPPITELLGGVIGGNSTSIPIHFGGASSVYTGVSSLDTGTVSSFGAGTISSFGTGTISSFGAGTVSSFGTGTVSSLGTGTISSVGTGFNTMDQDLLSSIFGRPPTAPPAAAPVPDDSAEQRAAAERAMFKKTGVPKAAVHCWYGQKPRRQIISQENYITWHDNGPPHLMHYTSLFICPMSGEAFGSGRYGDEKHYKTDANNPDIVWYKRKALAEHGAAARAFDCLVFREAQAAANGSTMAEFRIGKDEPYLASVAAKGSSSGGLLAAFLAVPSHVPSHLRSEVEALIRQGQAHMVHAPPTTTNQDKEEDDDDDDDVEEAAWKKNAYERQRDHEMQQQNSQQYDDQEMPQNELHHARIFDDP